MQNLSINGVLQYYELSTMSWFSSILQPSSTFPVRLRLASFDFSKNPQFCSEWGRLEALKHVCTIVQALEAWVFSGFDLSTPVHGERATWRFLNNVRAQRLQGERSERVRWLYSMWKLSSSQVKISHRSTLNRARSLYSPAAAATGQPSHDVGRIRIDSFGFLLEVCGDHEIQTVLRSTCQPETQKLDDPQTTCFFLLLSSSFRALKNVAVHRGSGSTYWSRTPRIRVMQAPRISSSLRYPFRLTRTAVIQIHERLLHSWAIRDVVDHARWVWDGPKKPACFLGDRSFLGTEGNLVDMCTTERSVYDLSFFAMNRQAAVEENRRIFLSKIEGILQRAWLSRG